jgi:hypothetical protein
MLSHSLIPHIPMSRQSSPSTSKQSVEETPSHEHPYAIVNSWFIPRLTNSIQLPGNAEGTCIVEVSDEEMDSSSDSSDSPVGKGKSKHVISDATKVWPNFLTLCFMSYTDLGYGSTKYK